MNVALHTVMQRETRRVLKSVNIYDAVAETLDKTNHLSLSKQLGMEKKPFLLRCTEVEYYKMSERWIQNCDALGLSFILYIVVMT